MSSLGWVHWVLLTFSLNSKTGSFYSASYLRCFKADKCHLWLSGFWLCRFPEAGKRACGLITPAAVYESINGGVNGSRLLPFLKNKTKQKNENNLFWFASCMKRYTSILSHSELKSKKRKKNQVSVYKIIHKERRVVSSSHLWCPKQIFYDHGGGGI